MRKQPHLSPELTWQGRATLEFGWYLVTLFLGISIFTVMARARGRWRGRL